MPVRVHNLSRLGVWAAVVILTLWIFPPFHIRHVEGGSNRDDAQLARVEIVKVANDFWNTRLTVPSVSPTDARVMLEALDRDPVAAGQRYGRRPGIGGPSFYFVQGDGTVSSVDGTGVWLDLSVVGPVRVVLQTGPIFGSALRDATGLLNLEDFSSFQFNELGAQLNRLAETQGALPLRSAVKIGSRVQFLAAGRISNTAGTAPVLKLAPIRVRVQ